MENGDGAIGGTFDSTPGSIGYPDFDSIKGQRGFMQIHYPAIVHQPGAAPAGCEFAHATDIEVQRTIRDGHRSLVVIETAATPAITGG